MIAIRTRLPVSATFALVLLLAFYPTVALAAPAATASIDFLDSYVQLIQRESMLDPSTSLLMKGASLGLNDYLKQHGHRAVLSPQTTIEGFKREFEAAAGRDPGLNRTEMLYASLRGMLKPLNEPYTRFLSPEEFGHLQARVDGTDECGLGCHLELDEQMALTIVEAFDKSPAALAGLVAGDRILAVDGRSTERVTLGAAKEMLSGPEGSNVRLTIRREGRTLEMTVRRAKMDIPSVTSEMLGNGVGYIRIHAFSANVASELDEAVTALDSKGAQSFVLDLRDNRGGYVSSAIDVASRFLPAGTRVMSLQQKRQPIIAYNTYPTRTRTTPLVLLVNERTASASEIVAGCLQDYKVATLVGTRTFGKGLVQKVAPLPDGSAFAISTGKYLTAKGRDLHKHGIAPDVVARQTEFTTVGLDPQVRQAADLLGKRPGVSSSHP